MSFPLVALDSAIGGTVACIVDGQASINTAQSDNHLKHSRSILPLLTHLMRQSGVVWQDIQSFVYVRGPGSFTGLRIAAATIAGLNASLKRPIFTVSALAVTATQSQLEDVWVIEDARAGELFVGHYINGAAVQEDMCISINELDIPEGAYIVTHMTDCTLLGHIMEKKWRAELLLARPEALAALAQQQAVMAANTAPSYYAEPVYLQLSQAERCINVG